MKKSGSQWSFANNSAAAYSQFLSFKSAQEQGGTHKSYIPGLSQRSLGLDKLGGSQHLVHAHPWQSKDVHISSQTSHLGPSNLTSSVFSSPLTPTSPSVVTTAIGAPPISTVPPSNGPIVGSTDLKNAPSISVGPCQLTLFYNGSVCVYDNVSPEKAQAIMLLAGNGESKNTTSSVPHPKVQTPISRPSVKDTAVLNHSPAFSSPILLPPVHSPVCSVSGVPSSSAVEVNPIKPVLSLTPPHINCPEPPKTVAPVGAACVKSIPSGTSSAASIGASGINPTGISSSAPIGASRVKPSGISSSASIVASGMKPSGISSNASIGASGVKSIPPGSAVPQARKASLARFLEKRKDRVAAAAPYVVNKNGSECSTTRAIGSTFLVNSTSSSPQPASI